MSWIELLDNPNSLKAVLKGEVPSLLGLALHEIELQRDGPALRLRFDLNSFPEDPPIKWAVGRFNTIQIELELTPVNDAEVAGITNISIVDLDVSSITINGIDSIRVRTTGDSTSRIDAVGKRLRLSSMSAYQRIGFN